MTSVNFGAGSESYGYDSFGRASSKSVTISGVSYPTQYSYNTASQLETITYPSGRKLRPDYDTRGRLQALRQVDSFGSILKTYASGVGYSVAGQVTGFTVGNGLVEQYTYSQDRLQLTNQKVLSGVTTLMDFTYNYTGAAGDHGAGTTAGNAGQLVSMTGTLNGASRDQTFRYDDLGRLEKATGNDLSGPWQRRFVYDRWGNRTQVWNATVGGTQTQQVNLALIGSAPSNRVSSYWDTAATGGATKTVSYDAGGNVTNDGTYTFTYDAENRIVQVNAVATGALVATYVYDSANRRIKKTVGATTTCSVWEGAQVIAEYNNAASPVSPNTEYIFTGGRMLAEERTGSGTTRFFHQDRLSVRLTTNSSGAVLGTQSHLPFGEALSESSEQQKWKFTTYERDSETGDDYAINRGYWPPLGRFRQADYFLGKIELPQTLNRYSYVGNDPLDFFDPMGLCLEPIYGLACVVGPSGKKTCERYIVGYIDTCTDIPRGLGVLKPFGFDSGSVFDRPDSNRNNKDNCETSYTDCFTKCVEANRIDNAIRDIGKLTGHESTANFAADLTSAATITSITNLSLNALFASSTGRVGVGGALPHPTTWQHRLFGFISRAFDKPSIGTLGKSLGRTAYYATAVAVVFEGFYDLGTIGRCAARCISCSNRANP